MTSIGPYRIAAWLSIPNGDGPFPALMLGPAYGSVVTPPHYDDRARYVALSLMRRGTRHADWPYAARFPGLLTDGIADPGSWQPRTIPLLVNRALGAVVVVAGARSAIIRTTTRCSCSPSSP